jgi:IS30 family transposase
MVWFTEREGGHWEGDLIICKRTRPVLVLHERKSRVTLAARLARKTAAETIYGGGVRYRTGAAQVHHFR